MASNRVNGSGNGARSGAQTLALLATPLSCQILRSLADGPLQQSLLRREVGSPAQTTLRAQLRRLAELGAVEKQRRNRFPGVLEYELAPPGRDLLFVTDVIERWLTQAPGGPLAIGGNAAKAAIRALAEGWSTAMLRALAAGPLSLTELDGVIGDLSYPSLERRLAAMRLAGQLEPQPGNGRGTPYAVTDWLRQGVAPIVAAARWERRHQAEASAAIGRIDAEAAFLLAMPLLRFSQDHGGSCRMAIELPNGRERRLAGVLVEAEGGRIASCDTRLHGSADSWALGSPAGWLGAMVEHDVDRLELGGDCRLAAALVESLHEALFELPIRDRP